MRRHSIEVLRLSDVNIEPQVLEVLTSPFAFVFGEFSSEVSWGILCWIVPHVWATQKIHVHLELVNVTVFGNRVWADVIKVRWSHQIRGGSASMLASFLRRGNIGHKPQGRVVHASQGMLRTAGRSFSPTACRGNMALLTLRFWTCSLWNKE